MGLNFIDLFAGIGGFRLGMEQAGHKCVGFCEIDKYARQAYKANFNTEGEWERHDITTVKDSEIRTLGESRQVDVICGGFPCQAFSVAGKRAGFDDTRGTLLFEITRFARILKPKYLFLENVKGLLNHDKGWTFETIINALDELGYDAEWQVFNSKNYIPQNRERVFIIGHLRGASTNQIFPFGRTSSQTLKQIIGGKQGNRVYDVSGVTCSLSSEGGGQGAKTGLYFVFQKTHGRTTTLNVNETGTLQSARTDKVPCVVPVLTPEREEKRQNGRRFKTNGEPMFTLTAQDRHGVYDGSRIRRLTPLECFRLQGFPDSHFQNARNIGLSDNQLYKQAGNGVTVPIVYDIAKRL